MCVTSKRIAAIRASAFGPSQPASWRRGGGRDRLAWLLPGLALCFADPPLLGVVGRRLSRPDAQLHTALASLAVLDIFAIAGGFVLRAVAGGVAAPVALSRWFVLVVTSAALFVAAGKRHAELRRTSAPRRPDGQGRGVVGTTPRAVCACCWPAAAAWLCSPTPCGRSARVDGVPWRLLTVDPFSAYADPLRRSDPARQGRITGGAPARRPPAARRRGGVARPVRPWRPCRRAEATRPLASGRAAPQSGTSDLTGWGGGPARRGPGREARERGGLSTRARGGSALACRTPAARSPAAWDGATATRPSGRAVVVDTTAAAGVSLDAEHGLVRAQAGLTIGELLIASCPRAGWCRWCRGPSTCR